MTTPAELRAEFLRLRESGAPLPRPAAGVSSPAPHRILAEHGGIDLSTYTRPAASTTLWNEITHLQKERNVVVHRAQPVSGESAEAAVQVARHILHEIFPQLIARIGLHLLSTNEVCGGRDPRVARERAGERTPE